MNGVIDFILFVYTILQYKLIVSCYLSRYNWSAEKLNASLNTNTVLSEEYYV